MWLWTGAGCLHARRVPASDIYRAARKGMQGASSESEARIAFLETANWKLRGELKTLEHAYYELRESVEGEGARKRRGVGPPVLTVPVVVPPPVGKGLRNPYLV